MAPHDALAHRARAHGGVPGEPDHRPPGDSAAHPQGPVYNVQGSGTYVADPAVVSKTLRLTGFTEDMRQRGLEPVQQGPRQRDRGRRRTRRPLQVAPGAPLRQLRRLRLADGVPMALESALPRHDRVRLLTALDFDHSLYEQARRGRDRHRPCSTDHPRRSTSTLEQARPSTRPSVRPPSRSSRSPSPTAGQRFEHAATIYRGDRYSFHIVVGRACDLLGRRHRRHEIAAASVPDAGAVERARVLTTPAPADAARRRPGRRWRTRWRQLDQPRRRPP